jgi:hypothetical protein
MGPPSLSPAPHQGARGLLSWPLSGPCSLYPHWAKVAPRMIFSPVSASLSSGLQKRQWLGLPGFKAALSPPTLLSAPAPSWFAHAGSPFPSRPLGIFPSLCIWKLLSPEAAHSPEWFSEEELAWATHGSGPSLPGTGALESPPFLPLQQVFVESPALGSLWFSQPTASALISFCLSLPQPRDSHGSWAAPPDPLLFLSFLTCQPQCSPEPINPSGDDADYCLPVQLVPAFWHLTHY